MKHLYTIFALSLFFSCTSSNSIELVSTNLDIEIKGTSNKLNDWVQNLGQDEVGQDILTHQEQLLSQKDKLLKKVKNSSLNQNDIIEYSALALAPPIPNYSYDNTLLKSAAKKKLTKQELEIVIKQFTLSSLGSYMQSYIELFGHYSLGVIKINTTVNTNSEFASEIYLHKTNPYLKPVIEFSANGKDFFEIEPNDIDIATFRFKKSSTQIDSLVFKITSLELGGAISRTKKVALPH